MMNSVTGSAMDAPVTYRICITGHVDDRWVNRLWGMKSEPTEEEGESPRSTLVGCLADQAALVGVINTLYNYGYAVLSVEPVTDEGTTDTQSTEEAG